MKTLQQYIEQSFLTESTISNEFVKLIGIVKRIGTYTVSRFVFGDELKVIGKRFIATTVTNSDTDKSIGTIIGVLKSNSKNTDIVGFAVLDGTSGLVRNIDRGLVVGKFNSNKNEPVKIGGYKVRWYGEKQDKQKLEQLIDYYKDVTEPKDEDKKLEEAIQMTTTTANGNSPAMIRLRGGSNTEINKIVSALNSMKTTLFIQQVQDNGTCVNFTLGRTNRPTVDIIVQRRYGSTTTGPRSFGVNAHNITDSNGEIIKDGAIALMSITDRTGVFGYRGTTNRLLSAVRRDNKVQSNSIAGVRITKDSIDSIIKWLKSLQSLTNGNAIATSWSKFVADSGKQKTNTNK